MKTWILAIAVMTLAFALPAAAQEPNVPPVPAVSPQWAVSFLGSDDLFIARGGVRPAPKSRTEFGIYGAWLDGLGLNQQEAWGGGAYATYDVIQDATAQVLSYSLPATIYVGVSAGFLQSVVNAAGEQTETHATAALMTGLSFGDDRIRIGIEGQYLLTRDLWRELADIPEDGRVLVQAEYRF